MEDSARCRTFISSVPKIRPTTRVIVSFTIDGVHPHDVSEILSSDGIDVRAGHHCAQPLLEYLGVRSSTRASMMFYNTPEEIDALIESVSTIRRRMGYGE